MAVRATVAVAVGGTDNNQAIGAAEEMMVAAMVTVAESTTAMVTVTIATLMPMPNTVHQ